MLLSEYLLRKLESAPGPALNADGRLIGRPELLSRVELRFAQFRYHGLRQGDRLVLGLPNSPLFVETYLAGLAAGLVLVPASPIMSPTEMDDLLAILGDVPVLCGRREAEVWSASARWQARKSPVLIAGSLAPNFGEEQPAGVGRTNWKNLHSGPVGAVGAIEPVGRGSDPAVLLLTGGSTGKPKLACLSQDNLLANLLQCSRRFNQYGPGTAVAALLPFQHSFGLTMVLHLALASGARLHFPEDAPGLPGLVSDLARAQGEKFIVCGSETLFRRFLRTASQGHGSDELTGKIRLAVAGAAPLGEETHKAVTEFFGCSFLEGYGLTEASPVVSSCPEGGPILCASLGKPLDETLVRLMDPGRRDPDAEFSGEDGELLVCGPQVMSFPYLQAPGLEQQDEVLLHDAGGRTWLRTGDLVSVGTGGYLFFKGRLKQLIKCGGNAVFPWEIERVLLGHPAVDDAAVRAVADPEWGERPEAWVVLKTGVTASERELLEYCTGSLRGLKVPRAVHIAESLPRSPVGKIMPWKLA